MCKGISRCPRAPSATMMSIGSGNSSVETVSGSYFESAVADELETNAADKSVITNNRRKASRSFNSVLHRSLRVPGGFPSRRDEPPSQFVDNNAHENHTADD